MGREGAAGAAKFNKGVKKIIGALVWLFPVAFIYGL